MHLLVIKKTLIINSKESLYDCSEVSEVLQQL